MATLSDPTASDVRVKLVAGGRIDPARLEYALVIRGKQWSDLAIGPHRLNPTTVTKIARGGLVRPATLIKVGEWLNATPIIPGLVDIVAEPAPEAVA